MKILIVQPIDEGLLKDHVINRFGGTITPIMAEDSYSDNFEKVCALGDENSTAIFVVEKMTETIQSKDVKIAYLVEKELTDIMTEFINYKLVEQVRLSPRVILMKSVGSFDALIEMVAQDYKGTIESSEEVLQRHNSGTVVFFTRENLNKALDYSEVYEKAVYINKDFATIIRGLNKHSQRYINKSRDNEEWTEVNIKIYDNFSAYDLHYKKLAYILEKLSIGLVFGEGWGTDAATLFRIVGIYRIKMLTFLPPEEVKALLVGLEYLEDGTRVVDYDLFLRKRKVHWDCLMTKELKRKEEIGIHYRKEILARLKPDEVARLNEYDKEILKTRTDIKDETNE